MGQINIKKTSTLVTPEYGKIAIGADESGIFIKNSDESVINYYTQEQTNANFLSANTSFYSQEQTNTNFLSATTNFDSHYLSANTSFYTQQQVIDNFTSALTFNSHSNDSTIHFTKNSINLDDLGDVNTGGTQQGYYLSYSAGTWTGVQSSGQASTDLSNYYTTGQTKDNFLSANTFDNQINYNINTTGNISASTYYANNLTLNTTSISSIIMTDVVTNLKYGICISGGTLVFTTI